jgi:organic radical activating enzyme
MMSFPLRLRADILRARFWQSLRSRTAQNLIVRLNPAGDTRISAHSSGKFPAAANSEAELLDIVHASAAPIVWIGGAEPLQQPAIGSLVRRIADSGRTVFVETDGVLLRRRIHEFRPVSRVFVTVKFHGLEQSHDLRAGRSGVFRAAVEGIRTAKLSGFLICAHALVDAETRLEDIAELKEYLGALDADGFLVSAAPDAANRETEILRKKVNEARRLIASPGWERFSRLLESQALPATSISEISNSMPSPPAEEPRACEESVRVS